MWVSLEITALLDQEITFLAFQGRKSQRKLLIFRKGSFQNSRRKFGGEMKMCRHFNTNVYWIMQFIHSFFLSIHSFKSKFYVMNLHLPNCDSKVLLVVDENCSLCTIANSFNCINYANPNALLWFILWALSLLQWVFLFSFSRKHVAFSKFSVKMIDLFMHLNYMNTLEIPRRNSQNVDLLFKSVGNV